MIANITSFLGRFHPAIVHLPIGILLLAFIFKLLSLTDRFKKLKFAVRPSLFCGMLSAFASVLTGYILSQEGGYDERLLIQHQWMGFATAGLSFLVYLFSLKALPFPKDDRKKAVLILFFPLIVLVLLTGHWGGSLTRGEDFLFESFTDSTSNSKETTTKKILPLDVDEVLVFNDIVRPVLEEKCFACHSAKKQKGQLRLDAIDFIQKGGKHGKILMAGNPNESELFKRITLSEEEKKHMPPKREPQLTSIEIELIRWWIKEGASFDKKAKEFASRDELMAYLKSLSTDDVHESWIPKEEVEVPDPSVMKELRSVGVAVVPVAASSNFLSISFSGKKGISPRDLELLNLLGKQIIDLNLSWTSVSDMDLKFISTLNEVRVLNLGRTSITDSGIVELKKLENLFKLNLVETKITDQALETLNEMKALKELYLFNTSITKGGLLKLNTQIRIDTGHYQLPSLSTDTIVFRRK